MSSRASAIGLPQSSTSTWARVSALARISPASAHSTRPRWLGSARDQSPRSKLPRAALTAVSMSGEAPAGISAMVSPVAGFSAASVRSLAAGAKAPATKLPLTDKSSATPLGALIDYLPATGWIGTIVSG